MSETNHKPNAAPVSDTDRERQLRHSALNAAIQINSGRGDYQEVIRAARDIAAFLKDG